MTADGNFSLNHVRQKPREDEVWLSDGTGMMWQREKAKAFIAAARNINTVCRDQKWMCPTPTDIILVCRKHHAKISFELLNGQCSSLKRVT